MSTLERLTFRLSLFASAVMTGGMIRALAQGNEGEFAGPIPDINGTPDPDNLEDGQGIRDAILDILIFVLNFLALVAVIFIIIAGIRLIVSQGSDEQKDKAKKTILYVIIGLLVILFARVIVGFFTEGVANIFN